MICFLCQNEVPDDAAQSHLCVKDNTALFRERRVGVGREEFPDYTDELDFFDAEQIIDAEFGPK